MANNLFAKTSRRRALLLFAGDALLICLSFYLSFVLRFESNIPSIYFVLSYYYLPVFLIVKIFFLYLYGMYRLSWRYVGLPEIISVFWAAFLSFLVLGLFYLLSLSSGSPLRLPSSIIFIDYILTVFFISAFRASERIFFIITQKPSSKGERTLLVGAGDAGEQILRNITENRTSGYIPVGFVDDDVSKFGISIHGIKVLGPTNEIPFIIRHYNIETILIAAPSASAELVRKIVSLAREADVTRIKILPPAGRIITGNVGLRDILDIQASDILGRSEVKIDVQQMKASFEGKTILVTGAAGSIGSELCRQLLNFSPKKLMLIDQDETRIADLNIELADSHPHSEIDYIVCDIRDKAKVERIFEANKPQIVFHSAAYKHVPIMERYPEEAVKTNIVGTRVVAGASFGYDCEKFVMLSTDKAVNPTSLMGATKRVAEMIITDLNNKGKTKFVAVRFGNVLESRGNIFALFTKQIKEKKAITITHPDMTRYLMSISEATLLVMQASATGESGEIFVLDMGKPIKVLDFAKDLIKLHGLEPDIDIPIVITGIRPGEKLYEEYLNPEEKGITSKHDKIFISEEIKTLSPEALFSFLNKLELLSESGDSSEIRAVLKQMIPGYKSDVL